MSSLNIVLNIDIDDTDGSTECSWAYLWSISDHFSNRPI